MVGDTKLEENSLSYQNIFTLDNDFHYIIENAYIICMLHNTQYVNTLCKLSQPKYHLELDTPKDNTKTI